MGCVMDKGKALYWRLYWWWEDDTLSSPFLMTESRLDALQCLECGGSGEKPCQGCDGKGVLTELSETGYFIVDCAACGGSGSIPCSSC